MAHGSDPAGSSKIKAAFEAQLGGMARRAVPILNQPTRTVLDWDALDLAPTEDWCICDFVDPGNTTSGGIFVAPKWQDTMLPMWRVRRCGPGKANAQGTLQPMNCKVGDVVVIDPTSGAVVELGTKKTQSVVVRSTTIVFVVENAAELKLELKDHNTLDGR
jgi:co-chaperonin GroES (HSP10)